MLESTGGSVWVEVEAMTRLEGEVLEVGVVVRLAGAHVEANCGPSGRSAGRKGAHSGGKVVL
jgi:hypothetical protein